MIPRFANAPQRDLLVCAGFYITTKSKPVNPRQILRHGVKSDEGIVQAFNIQTFDFLKKLYYYLTI